MQAVRGCLVVGLLVLVYFLVRLLSSARTRVTTNSTDHQQRQEIELLARTTLEKTQQTLLAKISDTSKLIQEAISNKQDQQGDTTPLLAAKVSGREHEHHLLQSISNHHDNILNMAQQLVQTMSVFIDKQTLTELHHDTVTRTDGHKDDTDMTSDVHIGINMRTEREQWTHNTNIKKTGEVLKPAMPPAASRWYSKTELDTFRQDAQRTAINTMLELPVNTSFSSYMDMLPRLQKWVPHRDISLMFIDQPKRDAQQLCTTQHDDTRNWLENLCCVEKLLSDYYTPNVHPSYHATCNSGQIMRSPNDSHSNTQSMNRPMPFHCDVHDVYNHSTHHMMVVVAHSSHDVGWLERIVHPWVVLYTEKPEWEPYSVPNLGHEASRFLKYIIDHYCMLPENMLFVHDHEASWHTEGSVVELINNIGTDVYQYASINPFWCGHFHGGEVDVFGMWNLTGMHKIRPWPMNGREPRTDVLRYSCCAQFLVSRGRVQSHALWVYQSLYNWLMTTPLHSSISGRVFEYAWHALFFEPWQHSPPIWQCLYPALRGMPAAYENIEELYNTSRRNLYDKSLRGFSIFVPGKEIREDEPQDTPGCAKMESPNLPPVDLPTDPTICKGG